MEKPVDILLKNNFMLDIQEQTIVIPRKNKIYRMKVDGIYSSCSEDLIDHIQNFLKGKNTMIAIYGQKNTGKSCTAEDLLMNTSEYLLEYEEFFDLSIEEIYNEKLNNLLGYSSKIRLFNKEEVANCLEESKYKRKMYEYWSSNSHVIYSLVIRSQVFKIVDLAVTSNDQTECKHIVRSNLALADCLRKLSYGKQCITYRNSLLTKALRPCLALDSKVVTLVCGNNNDDTLKSLKWASRIRELLVKNNNDVDKLSKENIKLGQVLDQITRDTPVTSVQIAHKYWDLFKVNPSN